MFGNLRISTKLLIMVGLSVLGIAAVAGVGLSALKGNLLEDRKAKLQEIVLVAHQALDLDYQAAQKAGLPEAEAIARSKALLRALHFGKDDYFFALDQNGIAQAHQNPKIEGKAMMDAKDSDGVYWARGLVEVAAKGGGFVAYRFPRGSVEKPLPKVGYAVEFKPYAWVIGSGIYIDDVDAIFWSQVMQIGTLIGIALVLVVGMSVLLGRSVVNPIAGMTAAMRKLAAGDTATEIPARERSDEVGAMAQSVQIFKDHMIEADRLRAEQDEMKAAAEAERKSFMSKMADEFESGVRATLDALGS
jgi:methyl-accepting chemotaxis protein